MCILSVFIRLRDCNNTSEFQVIKERKLTLGWYCNTVAAFPLMLLSVLKHSYTRSQPQASTMARSDETLCFEEDSDGRRIVIHEVACGIRKRASCIEFLDTAAKLRIVDKALDTLTHTASAASQVTPVFLGLGPDHRSTRGGKLPIMTFAASSSLSCNH
jgi:hypothetical protein